MTTASEVVQDLSGYGRDTGFGGDLLAAEGDRGGPQRPQRLPCVPRNSGALEVMISALSCGNASMHASEACL